MILHYDLADVAPYINWAYFYFAWQVKQKAEQHKLRKEAEEFMASLGTRYRTHALLLITAAYSDEDDIVLPEAGGRLPLLRQQSGPECLCLADFIAPRPSSHLSTAPSHIFNRIALFATSADSGLEHDFDADPYLKMMAQLVADRLAEATAERLHEQVRKELWGYAPDEQLTMAEMQQEHFQGIRPAVGYPSLPDAGINFVLDNLLGFAQIGITLTESGAMRPHASVSGLMLAHPEARYFSVGKIGTDQLHDYAVRRNISDEMAKKFLSANL